MNQLANYKLQLGQVEAALTGDPENSELLSLKKDLDEIIGITEELIDDTKKKVNLWAKRTLGGLNQGFGVISIVMDVERYLFEYQISPLDFSIISDT